MKPIIFIDTETTSDGKRIADMGALREDGVIYHGKKRGELLSFIEHAEYICGHNIVHHDLKKLRIKVNAIDTLYLSALLFPKRPYHSLVKDDKLKVDEINNPVNDCRKAMELFYDEVNAFRRLPHGMKQIFYCLLHNSPEFRYFFEYIGYEASCDDLSEVIRKELKGKICSRASLDTYITRHPIAMAYAISLIKTGDTKSVVPLWVLKKFPVVGRILEALCNTACRSCDYCNSKLDVNSQLKKIFGYDSFREYNGEPLQEKAVIEAVNGKSLLAIFPTGGGKSLTFQLPALMAGETVRGLTVVISPLQSLMKDQVDNLIEAGIDSAVAINGLLNPVERAAALEQVETGGASLLYISPEQLRSRTVDRIIGSRNVVRFVIDEAHCFSAWGQDFRVDYLFIGKYIKKLEEKRKGRRIPVSCFTATAKPKVIKDICDYFRDELGTELIKIKTTAERDNLQYKVLQKETDEEKYYQVRELVSQYGCPAIIYCARTKTTRDLAARLTADGFHTEAFYGRMDSVKKRKVQESFISNEIRVITATSAFGMGVDKKDVGLVIHYDISASLEDYIQEAGRAGRDPEMKAHCYILYNSKDLDKHFALLNQSRLNIDEIKQLWKGIKNMSKNRTDFSCSALELARESGWNDTGTDIETKVRAGIAALEEAGYIERGMNMPKVYATSINVKSLMEASSLIDSSIYFTEEKKQHAKVILKSLLSKKYISRAGNDEAESRVDYLADFTGISKEEVIDAINLMKRESILEDYNDMTAYIQKKNTEKSSYAALKLFLELEAFVIKRLEQGVLKFNIKELNQLAGEEIKRANVKRIRTILNYYSVKRYISKTENRGTGDIVIDLIAGIDEIKRKYEKRKSITDFIVQVLYAEKAGLPPEDNKEIHFSLVGIYKEYLATEQLNIFAEPTTIKDIEDALLYLSRTKTITLEGGFLVLYNSMAIKRLVTNNKKKYSKEDYKRLDCHYSSKVEQIHIVGEYARLMAENASEAKEFVHDYFNLEYNIFLDTYFNEERKKEISRNITAERYYRLFGDLSKAQSKIAEDRKSKCIVVAAGPGSGKTKVLVHKLASILLLEDIKSEQLLMLTFSRAAATRFKSSLLKLIGPAAHYVDIKTFHSYCFDILGKIGSLEESDNIISEAIEMIKTGEAENSKISKAVLVLDEAQDMDENEFNLIKALIDVNDGIRVVAVGDDDQNIYEFRGSDSKYMQTLLNEYKGRKYELTENFRSSKNLVAFAEAFARTISGRMKTSPLKAARDSLGEIGVVRYNSRNMETAVAEHVISIHGKESCCVLTNTNEEALTIQSILVRKGIKARLIQSFEGLSLYNLAEIRYFLKQIDKDKFSPVIDDELWRKSKEKTVKKYERSTLIELFNRMISDFEKTNRKKFRTDLEEFIKESKYEDFIPNEKGAVIVSTIHKAKGKEFDNVFFMLKDNSIHKDSEKRKIYVGITRARENLFIHTNKDIFKGYDIEGLWYKEDKNVYDEPEELAVSLAYKDVYLDFFKDKKNDIYKLRSGDELLIRNRGLAIRQDGASKDILRYSEACNKMMDGFKMKGYEPYRAEIRFVVAWKGENDTEESAVVLPDIYLKRQKQPE